MLSLLAALIAVAATGETTAEASSAPSSEPEDIFAILDEQEQAVATGFIPVKRNESAYGVWVIDRETILRMATTNIADVLRTIPGIVVRDLSAGFVETYLRFTSNFPNNQSLVLIDGRPILADIFGNADKTALELKDIERIEVTMGPSSTLYGSNALTGMINIVSRRPERSRTFVEAEVRTGVGFGSEGEIAANRPATTPKPAGTFYAALNHGWATGSLRVSLSGDYWPGFAIADVGPGTPGAGYAHSDVPARRGSGVVDVEQQAGEWQLRFRMTGMSRETTLPTFDNAPVRFDDYALTATAVRQNLAGSGDSLTLSTWGRFYRLGYSLYSSPYQPASLDGNLGSGEVKAQYLSPRFLMGNQLVTGAQARVYGYSGQAIPPNATVSEFFALYLEDQWRPVEQFLLTLGLRAETNESRALKPLQRFNLSPHAAVVYLPKPNHSLRLEYATSFRNPSLHESFILARNPDGVPYSVGNPALPLERFSQISFTYQATIDWFRPRVDIAATRVESVIISSSLDATTAMGSLRGVPLTMDYPSGSAHFLPAIYNAVPINAWLPVADLKLEGVWKPVQAWLSYAFSPIAPEHLASGGISTGFWRLKVSTELYFVSEYAYFGDNVAHGAGRLVWNAAVRLLAADDWTVSAEGLNMLDAHLAITRGAAQLKVNDLDLSERIAQRLMLSVRYGF